MSANSSRGPAWERIRLEVLESSGYICAYGCGREATTVDHIIAKANGGTDDRENLAAACSECNTNKGSKSLPVRKNWYNEKWLQHI